MHAPAQLLYENSKKITEEKGGKKSSVKTVIIGAVPDRGGRTDDIRKTASSSSGFHGRSGGGKPFGGKGGDRSSNKRGRY
jgi:hypothetical protein